MRVHLDHCSALQCQSVNLDRGSALGSWECTGIDESALASQECTEIMRALRSWDDKPSLNPFNFQRFFFYFL